MQSLMVGILVTLCVLYASWNLAPSALRRWVAVQLLGRQGMVRYLPCAWQAKLQKRALSGAGGGCGCDAADGEGGCAAGRNGASEPGAAQSRPAASWQPVQWTKQRRR